MNAIRPARLIAAAPEMAEALRGLTLILDAIAETDGLNPLERQAVDDAHQLLAKIGGEL